MNNKKNLHGISSKNWTPENDSIANRQGWGLFDTDGILEIQRDDEAEIFNSDDEALAYVKAAAQSGDKVAIAALSLHRSKVAE